MQGRRSSDEMQLTSELAPRLTEGLAGLGVFSERATRDHTGSLLREQIPRRACGGRLEEVQGRSACKTTSS